MNGMHQDEWIYASLCHLIPPKAPQWGSFWQQEEKGHPLGSQLNYQNNTETLGGSMEKIFPLISLPCQCDLLMWIQYVGNTNFIIWSILNFKPYVTSNVEIQSWFRCLIKRIVTW